MKKLQQSIRQFAEDRDWQQFHTLKNLSMGLSIEANELMEHFLWLTPEQGEKLPPRVRAQAVDELADVFIYLLKMADALGVDPVEAARRKMVKNARKYPVAKAKGRALKYTAYRQSKRKQP